jgi:GntR family transcriptional regulator, transcriptional repressor for pyruvate dehydrogenase complex
MHEPKAQTVNGTATVDQSFLYPPLARPKRLPDELVGFLANEIKTGKLRPGDRLPTEQRLAASFAVSRSVVREAISRLKHDGLVDSRQGTGAFVADPAQRTVFRISPECFAQREELRQILELLTGVQANAAARAAENRTQAHLRVLRQQLDRMARAVETGETAIDERVEAEAEFYRVVAEASGNTYLFEFIEFLNHKVMARLRSVVIKNARAVELSPDVIKEHEAVFRAISDLDASRARKAAETHFARAAQRLAKRADLVDVA